MIVTVLGETMNCQISYYQPQTCRIFFNLAYIKLNSCTDISMTCLLFHKEKGTTLAINSTYDDGYACYPTQLYVKIFLNNFTPEETVKSF
uniref:Uncharacterized protein n=1 Tax=Pyxicephalus adspersus TaxID=30357 RepID=A0AAV3A2Y9_PYXAD|nr:TPA: hypothetical protein GDO54_017518 [Pyxicephalus adspersus]